MLSYSHTNRIILLIDLDPLLHNHDRYTKTLNPKILSSAKTLLSFHPPSSSLFSFNLFFSSLSPLLSSSKLHPFLPKPSSLSFDHPSSTLHLLSQTLSSLPQFPHQHHPKSSHLAASITQILHDYPWDPDPDTTTPPLLPPNLLLLFSPLSHSFHSLSTFFYSHDDKSLRAASSFCERFSAIFGSVSRMLGIKGIHCTWVGVNSNSTSETESDDEVAKIRVLFEAGAAKLGWGFCSLDSILLGSALVAFGLIYPQIGISWFSIRSSSSKGQVQLSLTILDVNGSPIEYNCCDLNLMDFDVLGRDQDIHANPNLQGGGGCEWKERLWNLCSDGIAKLQVKVVRRCDAFVNLRDCLSAFYMNYRFYFGWKFYNQRLEVESKIPANRSLLNKYAFFWRAISATWKGDSLVIGTLKIMWQRSSKAGILTLLKMSFIESTTKWICCSFQMRMKPQIIYLTVRIASLNIKVYRDEMGEKYVSNEPVSAENEPFQLQKNDSGIFQKIIEGDRDKKLIEAKERRERARRFSSFTSWMPDLQRVWAPKQKGMKPKTDLLRKVSKRKDRQRASYDTVYEPPMTRNKRSSPWTRGSDDESHLADGSQPSGSVSKALFQDDL